MPDVRAWTVSAILALILAVGGWLGWKTISTQGRALAEAKMQIAADRKAYRAETEKSADLLARLDATQKAYAQLNEEIRHAPLKSKPTPPVNGECPGNPIASPDFERLFNGAAKAGPR